ncbi:hypothetical protein ACET3Z_017918 [Daucus carota]
MCGTNGKLLFIRCLYVFVFCTLEKRRHVHPTGFDVQYRYTDTENSNPNIMISGSSRTKTPASYTSLFTCARVNVTSPAVGRDNCSPSGGVMSMKLPLAGLKMDLP